METSILPMDIFRHINSFSNLASLRNIMCTCKQLACFNQAAVLFYLEINKQAIAKRLYNITRYDKYDTIREFLQQFVYLMETYSLSLGSAKSKMKAYKMFIIYDPKNEKLVENYKHAVVQKAIIKNLNNIISHLNIVFCSFYELEIKGIRLVKKKCNCYNYCDPTFSENIASYNLGCYNFFITFISKNLNYENDSAYYNYLQNKNYQIQLVCESCDYDFKILTEKKKKSFVPNCQPFLLV
jgi:hypothetical protein